MEGEATTSEEEDSRHTRLIEALTERMTRVMDDKFMNMDNRLAMMDNRIETFQYGVREGVREEIQLNLPGHRAERRRELFPSQTGQQPPLGHQNQTGPHPHTSQHPLAHTPEANGPVSSRASQEYPYYPHDETTAQQYYGEESDRPNPRRQRRYHEPRPQPQQQDGINHLKLKIPSFHGKNDPTLYLEWEQKMELIFNCQYFSETNKVNVSVTEFYDYALSWWDQLVTTRRRNGDYPIETWHDLKLTMRRRFVPSHFHRDLHTRLRQIHQGHKSVEEFFQEMETLLIRAGVTEDREATMSRFLSGLNRDIQDRLEMQHYVEIEEMLHKAILIEQQLKRKTNVRSFGAGTIGPKPVYNREYRPARPADARPTDVRPPAPRPEPYNPRFDKGKGIDRSTRNRDIKCFKCQGLGHYASDCTNKRAMILMDNGEYITEDEDEPEDDHEPDLEHIVEPPVSGQLMVARRSLSVQPKSDEQEQRENLFHTRCLVNGKVCSLIIDGGSCANIASETMVQKLGLKTVNHPKPYPLQWLNDSGELRVTQQVSVPIEIGNYKDCVTCDILPMEAGHLLLGRPWQSDRRVTHDGFSNRHHFTLHGRKITLTPMIPHEVYLDKLHLKQQKKDQGKAKAPKAKANFFTKAGEINRSLSHKLPVLLVMFKDLCLTTNQFEPVLPSKMIDLMQEYKDVFPEESPDGLPPIRGIEHQIYFIPGLPYRTGLLTELIRWKLRRFKHK